ncbi:MAG: hypothetical protein JWN41_1179 [Thermoleophilia bacterium]|nr:hypothetical protein [Thermoleophilia bacterium]
MYLDDAITRAWRAVDRARVRDRVTIERGDIRRTALDGADVVHMHLGPAFHDVLAERLETFSSPRTRVIAAGWKVPGWRPLPRALEEWSGGYVYRPADPRCHASWGGVAPLGHSMHVVTVEVHADLTELDVRFANAGDGDAVLAATHARRGQSLQVAYAAPEGAELTLWGRARDGSFGQRGPTCAC